LQRTVLTDRRFADEHLVEALLEGRIGQPLAVQRHGIAALGLVAAMLDEGEAALTSAGEFLRAHLAGSRS